MARTRSNDSYIYGGDVARTLRYTANGLNQYATVGSATYAYDANGNLTNDGGTTYVYDVENRLVSAAGAKNAALRYDPLGRLYETVGGGVTTRFHYDGDELVAEYNGTGTLQKRYVHGAGVDDPLLWREGGVWRQLYTDHQGSIVSVADANGSLIQVNRYDDWGVPQSGNVGRFQYTGQAWIPELGMYYYKARIYSPMLGRFMQTDPIGYDDQINLYAYVGNDPINGMDPDGKKAVAVARIVIRVAVRGERIERALEGAVKETVADWHELDEDSDASFLEKVGSVADIVLGTTFNDPDEADQNRIDAQRERRAERRENESRTGPNGNGQKPSGTGHREAGRREANKEAAGTSARAERGPTGARERNRGHPDGEEHSIKPKGNRPIH